MLQGRSLLIHIKAVQTHPGTPKYRQIQTEVFKFTNNTNIRKHFSPQVTSVFIRFIQGKFTSNITRAILTLNNEIWPAFQATGTGRTIINSTPTASTNHETVISKKLSSQNRKPHTKNPIKDTSTITPSPAKKPITQPSTVRANSVSKDVAAKPKPSPADVAKIQKKQTPGRATPVESLRPDQGKQHPSRESGNRYSTYLEFEKGAENYVTNSISSWLDSKNINISFDRSSTSHDQDNRRHITTTVTEDKENTYTQIKIVERSEQGEMFTTDIIIAVTGTGGWLYGLTESADGGSPGVPRFVADVALKAVVDRSQKGWHKGALTIDENNVYDLFEYLTSTSRQLPVFIIGTADDTDLLRDYSKKSKEWAKNITGNAILAVLSPRATELISEKTGTDYSPQPWTIRTYLPGLDLDDTRDSRRHRYVGQYRLASERAGITRFRLGRIANEYRASQPTPITVLRARKQLDLAANRNLLRYGSSTHSRLLEHHREASESTFKTIELTHEEARSISVFKSLLDIDVITDEVIENIAVAYEDHTKIERTIARLDEFSEAIEASSAELEFAKLENAELVDEIEALNENNDIAQRRINYMQRQLVTAGMAGEAYDTQYLDDDLDSVDSFADLLEVLRGLQDEGIIYTGRDRDMTDVDELDTKGSAIKMAVRCVRSLISYRNACLSESFVGGLYRFIRDGGALSLGPRAFADKESDTTMNMYGNERIFPVPIDVDPSGYTTMESHFKLAKIGQRSPRMYVLDNISVSGNIYIGYIGTHLTIATTN